MLADIFIFVFSLAAVVYWTRHTVLTILADHRGAKDAIRMAEGSRLEFFQVREALESSARIGTHGHLAETLGYDFLALRQLLRSSRGAKRRAPEERLLVWDFRLMQALYATSRMFSPRLAHFALMEMTAVLEYFADIVGRRLSANALELLRA